MIKKTLFQKIRWGGRSKISPRGLKQVSLGPAYRNSAVEQWTVGDGRENGGLDRERRRLDKDEPSLRKFGLVDLSVVTAWRPLRHTMFATTENIAMYIHNAISDFCEYGVRDRYCYYYYYFDSVFCL